MSPTTKLTRTYWGIGYSDSAYTERYLFESERAARNALRGTDYDALERLDPDGTRTSLPVNQNCPCCGEPWGHKRECPVFRTLGNKPPS